MVERKIGLREMSRIKGRALCIDERSGLYVSQNYRIFKSEDHGFTWDLNCQVPQTNSKSIVTRCRLMERLLRNNIQALHVMNDGTRLAIAHDGIYRAAPKEILMKKTWSVTRGSRPINFCIDDSRVLFGEYDGRSELSGKSVYIYVSEDRGQTFEVAYKLPESDVNHLHNIIYDPYCDHYWVFSGDLDYRPGIAILSKDLKTLEWVDRGNQMVRVVSAVNYKDYLVYGTDTPLEQNYIVSFDKKNHSLSRLRSIEGSSLFSAKFGKYDIITTCIEPSEVNKSKHSCIYMSYDGGDWHLVDQYRKDFWNPLFFQFGTIVLPYVEPSQYTGNIFLFSGQAVSKLDNWVSVCEIAAT